MTFKFDLAATIKGTLAVFDDPQHLGYLQQFGPIEVTKLGSQSIPMESLAEELVAIKRAVQLLASRSPPRRPRDNESRTFVDQKITLNITEEEASNLEIEIYASDSYLSHLKKETDNRQDLRIRVYEGTLRRNPDVKFKLRDLLRRYDVELD